MITSNDDDDATKNHWNFKTESYLTQQQALETIENKTNWTDYWNSTEITNYVYI